MRSRWHGKFQAARSSALLIKLIDSMFEMPSTTIARAVGVLGVTPAAASYNIGKLVDAGFLVEATGRQRNKIFIAEELVSFLGER